MTQRELRVITPLRGEVDLEGFYARAALGDGTEVALAPRLLGAVALTVGPPSGWTTFSDEWMFPHLTDALFAWARYFQDPAAPVDGWVRHVSAGRPTVRRRACRQCGRVVEWAETAHGKTPPAPACTHGDESVQ